MRFKSLSYEIANQYDRKNPKQLTRSFNTFRIKGIVETYEEYKSLQDRYIDHTAFVFDFGDIVLGVECRLLVQVEVLETKPVMNEPSCVDIDMILSIHSRLQRVVPPSRDGINSVVSPSSTSFEFKTVL